MSLISGEGIEYESGTVYLLATYDVHFTGIQEATVKNVHSLGWLTEREGEKVLKKYAKRESADAGLLTNQVK